MKEEHLKFEFNRLTHVVPISGLVFGYFRTLETDHTSAISHWERRRGEGMGRGRGGE